MKKRSCRSVNNEGVLAGHGKTSPSPLIWIQAESAMLPGLSFYKEKEKEVEVEEEIVPYTPIPVLYKWSLPGVQTIIRRKKNREGLKY